MIARAIASGCWRRNRCTSWYAPCNLVTYYAHLQRASDKPEVGSSAHRWCSASRWRTGRLTGRSGSPGSSCRQPCRHCDQHTQSSNIKWKNEKQLPFTLQTRSTIHSTACLPHTANYNGSQGSSYRPAYMHMCAITSQLTRRGTIAYLLCCHSLPDHVVDARPEQEGGDEHAHHGRHNVQEARMHGGGEEVWQRQQQQQSRTQWCTGRRG